MKHVFVLLFAIVAGNLSAQITMLEKDFESNIKTLQKKNIGMPFDSTYNFCRYLPRVDKQGNLNFNGKENDLFVYIGQRIYFPDTLRYAFKMDSQGVHKLLPGYYTLTNVDKRLSKGRKFNAEYEIFDTLRAHLEKVKNSYYKQLSPANNDARKYFQYLRDLLGGGGFQLFELLSSTGDTLYVTHIRQGISVGYFEKTKQLLEKKEFLVLPRNFLQDRDLYTKEEIELLPTSFENYKKNINVHPYSCTEVSVGKVGLRGQSYTYDIVAVIEEQNSERNARSKFLQNIGDKLNVWNSKSNDYSFYGNDFPRATFGNAFILRSEYDFKKQLEKNKDKTIAERIQKFKMEQTQKRQQHLARCISKYGEERGTLIANGNVAIGMDKEMCREAWGKPLYEYRDQSVEHTLEIWNYGSDKLYFENDVLKRITQIGL